MNDNKELIVRWQDGELLTEAEIQHLEQTLGEELHQLPTPENLSSLQSQLREAYPADADIPNADLFQRSLMEQLAPREVTPPSNVIPISSSPKYFWWAIGSSMAACFMLGIILTNLMTPRATTPVAQAPAYPVYQPVIYSANKNLSADYQPASQQHIIVVEGLEAIPDEVDLFKLAESQNTQNEY